ncbi:hypothetical protein PHBOTO_005172 [Pseudozyma hubeiensis]|nr:hypothetical protein PHBOTO_005172 [Pseudozyma hubeiensis]
MGSYLSTPELSTNPGTLSSQPEAASFDPFIGTVKIYLSFPSDSFDALQGLFSCIKYLVTLEPDSSRNHGMMASFCATLEVPGTKVHHVQTLVARLPGFLWCEARVRLREGRQDKPPAYDCTDHRNRREEGVHWPSTEALH